LTTSKNFHRTQKW